MGDQLLDGADDGTPLAPVGGRSGVLQLQPDGLVALTVEVAVMGLGAAGRD